MSNIVELFKQRKKRPASITFNFEGVTFKADRVGAQVRNEIVKQTRTYMKEHGLDVNETRDYLEIFSYNLFDQLVQHVFGWDAEGLDYNPKNKRDFFESFDYWSRISFSTAYLGAEVASEGEGSTTSASTITSSEDSERSLTQTAPPADGASET